MISILTVVRNDADGLTRTLNSVLGQTYVDWELCIKDGGSEDGTLKVASCAQVSDTRIRLLKSKDSGIYDAMNIALNSAQGDHVIFLNAGDVFCDSDSLHRMSEVIAQHRMDIYFFSSFSLFENRKKILRRVRARNYIKHGQPATHQATIFAKDVHLGYLFDLNFKISADYDALSRMLADGCTTYSSPIPPPIIFEVTSQSASVRGQLQSCFEMWRIQRDVQNLSLSYRIYSFIRRRVAQYLARVLLLTTKKY